MPERTDVHYFGAGPAALPTSVLLTAASAIQNYESTGLGLIEQSHRSASSTSIITSACQDLQTLLSVPSNTYTTLFMQGGGTTQFSAVYYNLISYWVAQKLKETNNDIPAVREALKKAKADYLVTGTWSNKATQEAQRLAGKEFVNIAVDSRKHAETGKFGDIPAEEKWDLTPAESSVYTYFCDNETVDGVEFPVFPKSLERRLVVADMSSNILSREFDVSKFAIVFAGAQKNVGGAGVTLILVRNEILKNQATDEQLRAVGLAVPPIMLCYPILAKNNSLYNTLPVLDVFICREVMKGLIARGGLKAQEQVAVRKAENLYGVLEELEGFDIVSKKGARSRMNIVFRIKGGDEEKEEAFVKGAEERGLLGLKGHRSVGGLRISNYNSITEEGAEKLAEWIREFAKTL